MDFHTAPNQTTADQPAGSASRAAAHQTPNWWPRVAATTASMRHFTGILLTQATPTHHNGTLRLQFADHPTAEAWERSGSAHVLGAALRHHGIDASITTSTAT